MKELINYNEDKLKEFAGFLKEKYLDDMATEELKIIEKMDIPLMKLFENMPYEQLHALTVKGLDEFLTNLEEGKAFKALKESMDKWERDELDGVSKKDIQPSDLIFIYGAQKQTLMRFIPKFTDTSEAAIEIVEPLTEYYLRAEDLAFKMLFKIRKETEDALKESEEKFRSVSQSALDGIVIADLESNIIFWNKGAEKMFGYPVKEILQKKLTVLMPERYREQHLKGIARFRDTGETQIIGKVVEIEALRSDGTEFPVELAISFFETSKGKFVSAIIHDISERKEAEEKLAHSAKELQSSNTELEEFAYVASHDMKEPLRMVSNYLQLLERRLGDNMDDEAKEYIDFALDGAKRMRNLITNLLEYSRVNRNNNALENVDLNDVLQEVLRNLEGQVSDKNAVITCDKLPEIRSDRFQMVQLFQNLISNALKFSDKKQPKVHIGYVKRENEDLFCVQDNGIGIDPKYKDKIFKMFQRLHSKEEYPGTGIGLAICKKIVERFGGEIWFESEPGAGTVFFFTHKIFDESAIGTGNETDPGAALAEDTAS